MTLIVVRGAAAELTDTGSLRGYAAVYGVPTNRQQQYAGTETIGDHAFDGLLSQDVVALVDHNPSMLLGRTTSGTLRLASDAHGLAFELDLPDTQLGRDTRELVRRGDLAGCSFTAAVGTVERTAGGVTHTAFSRLVDVSVVASPAYPETSVVARAASQQSLRAQLASIRAHVLMKGQS